MIQVIIRVIIRVFLQILNVDKYYFAHYINVNRSVHLTLIFNYFIRKQFVSAWRFFSNMLRFNLAVLKKNGGQPKWQNWN